MYSPVTVAAGVTFTVNGSVIQGDAPFTLGAGSALEFDATAADVVWTRATDSAQPDCKIVANGTANGGDDINKPPSTTGGNHARIFKTGANDAYFTIGDLTGTFYNNIGNYELTYCDVEGLSNADGSVAMPINAFNAPNYDLLALHCVFDGCGQLFASVGGNVGWNPTGNADFRIEYCKILNSVTDIYSIWAFLLSVAGSGTQTFIGNAVEGLARINYQNGPVNGNYFDDCPQSDGCTSFDDNTIRFASNDDTFTPAVAVENTYLLADNRSPGGVGNQHAVQTNSPLNFIGNVFEYPYAFAIDTPDVYFGNLGTAEIAYNLIIPSATDSIASGCLLNPGTGYVNHWNVNVHHNTVAGIGGMLLFMENFRDATIFDKLRSNLVASPSDAGTLGASAFLLHDSDSYGVDNHVDSIDPAENTHNWAHNGFSEADPDSSVVRIGYHNVRMSVNPTGPNEETSGSGYDGTGPQFVDPTRNAAAYAVMKGWAAGGDTLVQKLDAWRAGLMEDPREGPLCLAWVRAGFAPQNPLFEDSDHAGTAAIGAMDFVAEAASGTFGVFESPIIMGAY
jgi:hypothetical protein